MPNPGCEQHLTSPQSSGGISYLWTLHIDESLISELLDFNHDVGDNDKNAGRCTLLEQSGVVEAPGLCYRSIPAVVTTVDCQMAISKGRQEREAQNVLRVSYILCFLQRCMKLNLRFKEVGTDVLVTAYEPLLINPLSEVIAQLVLV
ncbi:hypothetical protein QYF36_002693 [Acer negundo]|nr:hypothetical protein QYF36_002693 [Acer negundo]